MSLLRASISVTLLVGSSYKTALSSQKFSHLRSKTDPRLDCSTCLDFIPSFRWLGEFTGSRQQRNAVRRPIDSGYLIDSPHQVLTFSLSDPPYSGIWGQPGYRVSRNMTIQISLRSCFIVESWRRGSRLHLHIKWLHTGGEGHRGHATLVRHQL